MRLRFFVLGLLVGIACAPARGPDTVRLLRNQLARAIDATLRIGLPRGGSGAF